MKPKPHSEIDSDESHNNNDKGTDGMYVVDKTVLHIGSGTRIRYVARWYRYTKADDTAGPAIYIPQHFSEVYWRRFDKWKRRSSRYQYSEQHY